MNFKIAFVINQFKCECDVTNIGSADEMPISKNETNNLWSCKEIFFFKSTMVLYTQETKDGNVSFVCLINFKVLKAEVKRTRNLEG